MVSVCAAAPGALPHTRPESFAREHVWTVGLCVAMFVWTLGLFLVVRDHFLNFRLARYDLGNMVQAVWSTAQVAPSRSQRGSWRSRL